MSTLAKKWIGLAGVGIFCMSMAASPADLVLWGKQTAGSGHAKNAKVEGNRLELSMPTRIVKVEGDARAYTIWAAVTPKNRTARAVLSGGTGKRSLVGQTLPAGTYTVLPGLSGMAAARITITFAQGAVVPAPPSGANSNYSRHARTLIAQAVAAGPSAYTKLTIKNPQNGAVGAAARVAQDGDPNDAAAIMIEVGQALIRFANATPANYKGYPSKNTFYGFAFDELNAALRYADQLAKTDPLGASDLVIRVAGVLANTNPDSKPLRDQYRYRATILLAGNNPSSARLHANKIKDPAARKMQLAKIDNQKRALGL